MDDDTVEMPAVVATLAVTRQPAAAIILDPERSAAVVLSNLLATKFEAAGVPWNEGDTADLLRVLAYIADMDIDAVMDHLFRPIDLDEGGTARVLLDITPLDITPR